MIKKQLLLCSWLLVGLFFIAPLSAAASELAITGPAQIVQGDEFTVSILINTEEKAINALEIEVLYASDVLEVLRFDTSKSIIELWSKEPFVNQDTGTISFSGGIPYPGYNGKARELLSIIFRAKAVAATNISVSHTSTVLLNDGLGTRDTVSNKNSAVTITAPITGHIPEVISPVPDTIPPTDLQLEIGREPAMFGGNYFAAFIAKDNESGISHYEIAEKPLTNKRDYQTTYPGTGDWKPANSPYVLENQSGINAVFIKAVDSAGNFTVESTLLDANTKNSKQSFILLSVLLTLVILMSAVIYRLWPRKIKNI